MIATKSRSLKVEKGKVKPNILYITKGGKTNLTNGLMQSRYLPFKSPERTHVALCQSHSIKRQLKTLILFLLWIDGGYNVVEMNYG